MILLANVRDWLKTFEIGAKNYYAGKLDNKKDFSIGVYSLNNSPAYRMTIGGLENKGYSIKFVSVLIHWNKNSKDAEQAAQKLFNELSKIESVKIDNNDIDYIQMLNEGPISVYTDENGIYEYVIDMALYVRQ